MISELELDTVVYILMHVYNTIEITIVDVADFLGITLDEVC